MFQSKSIKTKYLFTGMLISCLSIVLVSVITYIVSFRITADLMDKRIKEITLRKAVEFDHWFQQKKLIIETLAQDISASGDLSKEYLVKLLKNKIKIYANDISDFYVGFEDKNRRALSGVGWIPPEGFDATVRPWYRAAVQSDSVVLTEPYVDAMSGTLVVTVAKSLKMNGKLIGVICTDIFITEVIKVVNSFNIGENSYALLLNEKGEILAHPYKEFLPTVQGFNPPDEKKWPEYKTLVNILMTRKNNDAISISDYTGGKTHFIFSTIDQNQWKFGIAISQSEYKKPLQILYLGFGIAFLISILIGLGIMYRMIKSMIAPVQSLTQTVSSFSEENLLVRAEISSDDEIGTLARAFNTMADTISNHSRTLETKVELRTQQLKEKNDKIMESLSYARRLQNAIIPNLQQKLGLDENQYFSIWKPRDTVGGDMFWCKTQENKKLLVVADCTGHGVPGALMTMTLSSILDAAAREIGLGSPLKILELVNQRLKENLMENNDDALIRDGADVAMLLYDNQLKTMTFVGAGISLFTADNGKVEEYKGHKNGIGYSFGKEIRFEEKKIPYKPGLKYYITTDGFLDQNKDPKKGGFGKEGLIKLIEKIFSMSMKDQKKVFENEIDLRLEKVSQRDDITIIGIEII